ncbi:MAG: hypothetical protein JZU55_07910 [Afipia sp.]|nr:hypothetical protein [Afipia sp.]
MPDRYGFEIVHARRWTQSDIGTVRNKTSAHQLKIYAKSNHSNFTQCSNRRFIRNRDGAERFKTDEAAPVNEMDGV